MIIIEGIVVCFIVLLGCEIGIANGPQGMLFLYEKDVKDRVYQSGLISEKEMIRNAKRFKLIGLGAIMVFLLVALYGINGARGFWEGFWQMTAILLVEGIFDRFFIDWYWVGHTKAWEIQGTEDLKPYIPKKAWVKKWLLTIVGFPILAAVLSVIMMFFLK